MRRPAAEPAVRDCAADMEDTKWVVLSTAKHTKCLKLKGFIWWQTTFSSQRCACSRLLGSWLYGSAELGRGRSSLAQTWSHGGCFRFSHISYCLSWLAHYYSSVLYREPFDTRQRGNTDKWTDLVWYNVFIVVLHKSIIYHERFACQWNSYALTELLLVSLPDLRSPRLWLRHWLFSTGPCCAIGTRLTKKPLLC